MGTLTPLIHRYVTDRRDRAEISALTAADYRTHLAGLDHSFGDRPLGQLGAAAIDRWLATIGALAPASRRHYLSVVRGFCRWLVAQHRLRTDPTAHVPRVVQPRRDPRTLPVGDVGRLLCHTSRDPRAHAIVWLMVGCGLRCVEVSRLQVGDFDGRTLLVRGKGGHERTLPVPVRVAGALHRYLDVRGVVAGPLVRSELGPGGLAAKTISGYVRGWMIGAGVKACALDGRSAHALRRTCASDIADATGDVRIVQEVLGHARIETASRYVRRVPLDALRRAMEGRDYPAAA